MVGMYTEKHTRPHKETERGKTEVEGRRGAERRRN